MARPPIDLGPEAERQIALRTARGESARSIAVALGNLKLQRTIGRRIDELKGKRHTPDPGRGGTVRSSGYDQSSGTDMASVAKAQQNRLTPEPGRGATACRENDIPSTGPARTAGVEVPEQVPENAPTEDLDRWLSAVKKGLDVAEERGDLQALASLAAKATALMTLKHKSAPLPKADLNESPDFRALARAGEERLLTLVRGVFST